MRQHVPVDVVLPTLRPLAVVLPDDGRAVSQDVGYKFETGTLLQETGGQRVTVPMSVSALHPRFPKHRGQRPLRDSDNSSLRRVSVPELVRAVLGSVAR